jgi:type I restriction enzyme S subunit
MKKGWQKKRIGEIATIKPPKSEARERVAADALVSFLPMEDLGIAIKYPEPKQTKRLSDVVGSYTYFADGDVLLAKITPCFENGKLGIAKGLKNGIGFGSSEFIVIRPDSTVSNEWLFHFLSREDFRNEGAQRMGGAVGQQRVPKEFVEGYEIPVPPLAEQQRIVGVLDEAFAGLATAQAHAARNLQNARALFESHLQSVFTHRGKGWVEKPLGDICDFLNGFAFKSGDAVPESQTQLVRMGNLYGNRLDLDRSPVFYPDDFAAEYSRYVLGEGDIIMSLTGTTGKEDYGFAVRIPDCGHTLLMNQRIMKFDAIRQDIIDDGYLLHYMRSRCFLDVLYPTANGTRQANLSSVTMKSLPVPMPALSEQKRIVTQLDALAAETQRLTRLYEQKQAALAALKKSLLHQAFTGEL